MDKKAKPFLFGIVLERSWGVIYVIAMIYMTLSLISDCTRQPKPAKFTTTSQPLPSRTPLRTPWVKRKQKSRSGPYTINDCVIAVLSFGH
jgi:hypothetical protein